MNKQGAQSSSKRERKLSIIREFSLNTSTHGIPGIARSENKYNRIFWSISLMLFIGIMLYFITTAVLAYLKYPTQTSIDIVVEWPQTFPAVTICNYSPFLYDRFIGPFLNYTNTLNLTNTTDTANFSRRQASYVREFQRYMIIETGSMENLTYPLESMLINCSYNDVPCSAANFIPFVSLRYGTCYIFNAKPKNMSSGNLKYNSDNGGEGRLALNLYVHRHQYIPYVTQAVGIMALVHDNSQFPVIASSGMQLSPGRSHRLGYTKRTNTFLPSPYTSCSNEIGPAMQALYNRYENLDLSYSQAMCYSLCTQKFVYRKCGCVSAASWGSRFIDVDGSDQVIIAPICNWTDTCPPKVVQENFSTGPLRDTNCPKCGQECTSNTFLVKSSALEAPVDSQMQDIEAFVQSRSIRLPANWSTDSRNEILHNYVALEVICETTRTEIYTQQAAINLVDVISNIGGQTGLWLGISFLSIMEVTEMLYRLIRAQCHSLRNISNGEIQG